MWVGVRLEWKVDILGISGREKERDEGKGRERGRGGGEGR